jgi:hypothetical protein
MGSKHEPAGPRPYLVGGFALGLALLVVAYLTFFDIHNLWEFPVGLYLVVMCIGKMAAK